MKNQQTFGEKTIARWNPYINSTVETHLEFSVWYIAADGRTRWKNGIIHWDEFEDAATLLDTVMGLQTEFLQQQWVRVEVHIPNRDHFGHLRPGFIQDTGLLLATREVLH